MNRESVVSILINNKGNPTFLLEGEKEPSDQPYPATDIVEALKSFPSTHSPISNAHCYVIDEHDQSIKIKQKIKNLEKFCERRPDKNTKNYAIIDFDYINHSTNEFHRLLKITEEPPKGSQVILFTKDAQNLPKTILSRVVRLPWKEMVSDVRQNTTDISMTFNKSLFETVNDLKANTSVQTKKILEQTITTSKMLDLNYNQIKYLQGQIHNISKYHDMNLRPLEESIYMLKKMAQK